MLRCLAAAALVLLALPACVQERVITINGSPLDESLLTTIETIYSVTIESGAYWYDAATGAWGLDGAPTGGFILPGLDLGGPLRADASRGQTGVFINGRNLPAEDLGAFESLAGPIPPGRYWLDRYTNAGLEGGPAIVNFASLAQQSGGAPAQSGGESSQGPHRNWYTGTGSNSSGGSGYVMGSDWSVSW